MGLIKQLPSYIAGSRIDADPNDRSTVVSMKGDISIPVATTNATQLRQALRYADASQEILNKISIQERVEVVKLVLRKYAEYREQVVWGLGHFRGMVAKDSLWMSDLLIQWSEQVGELVEAIWGLGRDCQRPITHGSRILGNLGFCSRGKAAIISSSTMDGPPGVAAICHALLSGTHVIVRPSWKDTVTHFMFEILHENKLDHFGQMVRWQSTGTDTMALNQQLIRHVQQAIVFCSDKTFEELISGMGEENRKYFVQKINKYGTGLPLVIVTENTDLDYAAKTILLGARRGNGKFCLSHSPVLVHQKVHEALTKKLTDYASKFKGGDLFSAETEKGLWEESDIKQLARLAKSFGGKQVFGEFGQQSMDLVILDEVPQDSACLHQEYPGTLLAVIPFSDQNEAVSIAQRALKVNNREAWTAVNLFSSPEEYRQMSQRIDAYHFLDGGVTSEPKFLLPHQGRYFAFDLSRRITTERK